MKQKKAYSQAGTETVKTMLKSGWMIAFITVFSLIAAFAAYSAMTAGLYSGMAARIAFAVLYAYAAAQLVLLHKKADVKALHRLTGFCLLLCVGTWILAGITLILTVIYALGIDSHIREQSTWIMGAAAFLLVCMGNHFRLVRKALLQAKDMLEGNIPQRDAFRPAAVSAFTVALLSAAVFIFYRPSPGSLSVVLILAAGIILRLSLGFLFLRGSRRLLSTK